MKFDLDFPSALKGIIAGGGTFFRRRLEKKLRELGSRSGGSKGGRILRTIEGLISSAAAESARQNPTQPRDEACEGHSLDQLARYGEGVPTNHLELVKDGSNCYEEPRLGKRKRANIEWEDEDHETSPSGAKGDYRESSGSMHNTGPESVGRLEGKWIVADGQNAVLKQVLLNAGVKVPQTQTAEHFVASGPSQELEYLAQRLNDLRTVTSETSRIPAEDNEREQQYICDELWIRLKALLHCSEEFSDRFDKSEIDQAMELLFGTIDKPGHERYDPEFVKRVFSCYLARKCLVVNKEEQLKASILKFKELVTTAVDPAEPVAVDFIRALSRHLFTLKGWENFSKDVQAFVPTNSTAAQDARVKRDAFYNRGRTNLTRIVPKAILSGGKIRVITLDSHEDIRFSPLNTFMSKCLQRQQWCLFGRTVPEWLSDPKCALNRATETLVSGDLQSATDTFAPELANAVLEELASILHLDEEDLKRMKFITTEASLEFGPNDTLPQLRGQLMGSILSFPILCLVSFTAWAVGTDFATRFLLCRNGLQRQQMLDAAEVGVNGDDIVFADVGCGQGWVRGVEAIRGIVSRGKSLCSSVYFTVNSELWEREINEDSIAWHPIGAVRPSLLFGICDGRKATPDDLWDEWTRGVDILENPEWHDLVKGRCKSHLPPSMGGIGLDKKFVRKDVLDWYFSTQVRAKVPVRPKSMWTDKLLGLKTEDSRTSTVVCIPRACQFDLLQRIRKPYLGTAEWTVTGKPRPEACRPPSLEHLQYLYEREWMKYENDWVEVSAPARVMDRVEELGGFVLERRGEGPSEEVREEWAREEQEEQMREMRAAEQLCVASRRRRWERLGRQTQRRVGKLRELLVSLFDVA